MSTFLTEPVCPGQNTSQMGFDGPTQLRSSPAAPDKRVSRGGGQRSGATPPVSVEFNPDVRVVYKPVMRLRL